MYIYIYTYMYIYIYISILYYIMSCHVDCDILARRPLTGSPEEMPPW